MTSKLSPFVFGFLLVAIASTIQSAPIDPTEDITESSNKIEQESVKLIHSSIIAASPTTTVSTILKDTSTTTASTLADIKKNRYIDSYEHIDDFIDASSDEHLINNQLYTKVKEEKPAALYNNLDKSVDTTNRNLYTDILMDPDEYINLTRKRRNLNLKFVSTRRHKRALTLYNLYDNDPFYESLIDRQQYIRPNRAYGSIYIPIPRYERNIRTAFSPYFYELPEWNQFFANAIENSDIKTPFSLIDEEDNGDDDDEYVRFPFLSESSNIPEDNLQLQQTYSIDDEPIYQDNEDEDERLFMPYSPIESYYK